MLVGVSDEGLPTLKKWADAKGVKYPVIHAPKAMASYEVPGFPTVFSVDASGRISQRGQLTKPQIEERLQQVRWLPDLGATPVLQDLQRLWEAGKFAELDRKLRDAEQGKDVAEGDKAGAARVRKVFTKLQEGASKEIEGLRIGPDYLLAEERLRELEKLWQGFEAGADAKRLLAEFKKDSRIRNEYEASKKLRDVLARNAKGTKARVAALEALVKRYPSTYASSQAQDALRER